MADTRLDVAARAPAEELIRESRERFELALKGANLGSWDWNIPTGEVISTPRCAEMRGFRPDELRPDVASYLAGIHPEDLPAFQKALSDHIEGARPGFECEYRASTKSGGWVWVLSQGKVFARDEAGRPTRMVGTALDITARRRTEEALHQTQERLELALKGGELASWDWNVMTGDMIFNARWAEMRGFRPEEVRPHVDSCISGIHPDDLAALGVVQNACLEGVRAEFECEYRAATKGGDWIWVLDRGKVFGRDARGKATRMVGTELDITERKHAEGKLRLSEAKSSGIVSISADAIISVDDNQRITLFNEGAEKIFGRSRAEAIGAPLDILIPERFRGGHRGHLESFAAGPDAARRMGDHGAVILGVRKNGEEFPADAAISKIVIEGKSMLTVALRDITEQKQAEIETRLLADLGAVFAGTLQFEDRLTHLARLLARDLADVCVIDVIGDDGTVRRARVACRDETREWLGDVLMQTQADGERSRVAGHVLETGQGVLIAKVTPDVIRSWARTDEDHLAFQNAGFQSAISVPLVARDKALGAVSLLSLSRVYGPGDFRVAEVVAQRASVLLDNARLFDTAKHAIKARDDILGIVAHDLRNPLAAIAALGTVLRLSNTNRHTDEEIGEEIGDAVNRMNRLIQDLLDVTSIDAGHLSLKLARLQAAEIGSETLEAQKPLAASASLELRLDAAPNLPDLWADHDRLVQVFDNLIGNAIKFTKPHGQITLTAAVQDGEVLFSVADTGRGIASVHLPHVFDRFWQAQKDKRRGAGLGLAIAKGIVEAHGGRIWVESAQGQGSTFFFTIPIAATQATTSHSPVAQNDTPQASSEQRVLTPDAAE